MIKGRGLSNKMIIKRDDRMRLNYLQNEKELKNTKKRNSKYKIERTQSLDRTNSEITTAGL